MKPYMVQALLRKRNPKRQTRRLVAPYNSTVLGYGVTARSPFWKALRWRDKTYPPMVDHGPHMLHPSRSEYIHVAARTVDRELVRYRVRCRVEIGDLIYVKESIWFYRGSDNPHYCLSEEPNRESRHFGKYLSPLFMAKRYARLWFKVTHVRAQRLQKISVADAIAEGLHRNRYGIWTWLTDEQWRQNALGHADPVKAYGQLFRLINGDAAWHKNPFVWVYNLKPTARPVLGARIED